MDTKVSGRTVHDMLSAFAVSGATVPGHVSRLLRGFVTAALGATILLGGPAYADSTSSGMSRLVTTENVQETSSEAPATGSQRSDSLFTLSGVNDENLFDVPPIELILDASRITVVPQLILWDSLAEHEIPLTGAGPVLTGSLLSVPVPELEGGSYELRWSVDGRQGAVPFGITSETYGTDGEKVIRPTVLEPGTSPDSSGPLWILAAAGVMLGLFIAVAVRKRRILAVVAFVAVAAVGIAGSIVLAPTSSDASEVPLSKCRSYPAGSVDRFTCLRDYVFASSSTPTGMMNVLDSLRSDASVVGGPELQTCHNVAHLLGRHLVEKGFPITEVVSADRGWCSFGLMHGALENGARLSTDDAWREVLVDVCSSFTGETALQCSHGAGHGTALRTNNSLSEGVSMCKGMSGQESERLLWQCATGLFMGYSIRVNIAMRYSTDADVAAALPDPDERFMPDLCPTFEGSVRSACWLGAFRHLSLGNVSMFADDERFTSLKANLDICDAQTDANLCVEGVVMRAADPETGRTQADVAKLCGSYSDKLWEGCAMSLVNASAARYAESPDADRYDQAAKVCDVIDAVRPGWRTDCLDLLDRVGPDLR